MKIDVIFKIFILSNKYLTGREGREREREKAQVGRRGGGRGRSRLQAEQGAPTHGA